ncbi:MAG: hypothetical protein ABIN01_24625 [Ferruginibacter sp.]
MNKPADKSIANSPNPQQPNYEVMSYYLLRQLIGILGIALPFILTFGAKYFGHCNEAQPSISHYYYSITHIVFVGVLCVLGGFLITYRGKTKFENYTSNLAGAFAFGVAIFPTNFNGFVGEGGTSCQFIKLTTSNNDIVPAYIGRLHFGLAALLFICFVIFCLKIFQELDDISQAGYKKQRRNRVYKICGYAIMASIVCIAGITFYNDKTGKDIWPNYIYWFETTSLLPFGISWLLKGSVNWPHSTNSIKRKVIQYLR